MLDIKFYEVFEEEQAALEKVLKGSLVYESTKDTIQEAGDQDLPARVISVRTQSVLPLAWADQLEGILTRSQGYDHLTAYLQASDKNIACGYLPDYCSRAVAEHAVLMMMALLRKFKKQTQQFYQFKRDGITGQECLNRRVLVVGVGKIGSKIVEIAHGLSMDVCGVDCAPTYDGCPYVTLEQGVRWADIIFSAVPLNDETQSMFDYACLSKARAGCLFINISRGEISPIQDLIQLLDEKILAGLSCDVFEHEKQIAVGLRSVAEQKELLITQIEELANRDNVILTPHNAFNTHESVERKAYQSAEALAYFFKNNEFVHSVNI